MTLSRLLPNTRYASNGLPLSHENEALVTTATGLTIAIPVLLLYQFLQGRVDNLIDEIDEAGSDFVLLCAETPKKKAAGRKKAGA